MPEWIITKVLDDGKVIEKPTNDPSVADEWTQRAASDPRYSVRQLPTKETAGTGPRVDPGMNPLEATGRLLQQGAQAGFSDELMAKGSEIGDTLAQKYLNLGYKIPPRDYLAEARAKLSGATKELGPLAPVVEGVGAMAIPGVGATGKALGPAGRIAEGAAIGGLYNLGASEEKKLSDVLLGMAGGATLGAGMEALRPTAKFTKGAAKGIYRKAVPESAEESLYKQRAKAEIGPSREETAIANAKALRQQQDTITDEIKATNDLIAEHGGKVKQALQDDITANVTNDLGSIKRSMSIVLDEAHTGLKGDMAKGYFTQHLSSLPDAERINVLSKASKYTSYILDNAEELIDDIMDSASKGLIKAPGADIKQYKKSIDYYRSVVRDSDKMTTGFKTMYGGKKYAEPPKFMAENLQKMYIALDDMKRALGKIHDLRSISTGTREKIENLYESSFRKPLTDERLWGPQVSSAQKEINNLWWNHLKLDPAIERRMFQSKGMQTQTAENPWKTYGEAEWSGVSRLTANPDSLQNANAMRDFDSWLDNAYGLSGAVTKHYKPTEKLFGEVKNIANARDSIRRQFDHARTDVKRYERVGVPPEQRAIDEAQVYASRLPKTTNVEEIERLSAGANKKALERTALGDEERAILAREKEPTSDVGEMKRRLEADKDYERRLSEKEEAYRDIDRNPLERAAVRGIRGVEKAGKWLGQRHGGPSGVFGANIVEQMWGDRPISTEAQAEEKANQKALEKDKNISKEKKDEIYFEQSLNDRKNKPSKTTIV